jgi:hypothetical protein
MVGGSLEGRNVTLQNLDSRLGLYQGHLNPEQPQLIFWQGDVRATTRLMVENGALPEPRFREGPVSNDEGHVGAMLRDPDGQPIYLVNIPGVTLGEPASA